MSKDKPLPILSSDEEAEDFVGSANLTDYDLSPFTPTRFEFSSRTRGCTRRRWSRRCAANGRAYLYSIRRRRLRR